MARSYGDYRKTATKSEREFTKLLLKECPEWVKEKVMFIKTKYGVIARQEYWDGAKDASLFGLPFEYKFRRFNSYMYEGYVDFLIEIEAKKGQPKSGWWYRCITTGLFYTWKARSTGFHDSYLIYIQDETLRRTIDMFIFSGIFGTREARTINEVTGEKWVTVNVPIPIIMFPEGTIERVPIFDSDPLILTNGLVRLT